MTTWLHRDVYAQKREFVTRDLSEALFSGELALLLGAGISYDFGLPSWAALVRSCLSSVGLPADRIKDDASFAQLISAARDYHEKCSSEADYLNGVQKCLYVAGAQDRARMTATPQLTAIGALLMGSRRGRVRDVWTLNFDDVLEWYLRVHGFVSQVITDVPCLLRDVDVTVYHPHGFLPLDERHGARSGEIVFDDASYAKRMVGKLQPWRDAVHWALRSKVFLAIGLSWSDDLLKNLIFDAAGDVKDRPTAFWFFGPDCPEKQAADCLRNNVVPLKFDRFSDYGPFLLGVCEGAMQNVG